MTKVTKVVSSSFPFPSKSSINKIASGITTTATTKTPFVCSVLSSHVEQDGYVHVLQRLVSRTTSSSLLEGEVEVCLEEDQHENSWKILVRDGMRCVVHQTFTLPYFGISIGVVDATTNSNNIFEQLLVDPLVCWAYFAAISAVEEDDDYDDHYLQQKQHLCVLVSWNQLQIFLCSINNNTVEASSSSSSSDDNCASPGNVVPLPFDACSIYTNPLGGIFIQRAATADDDDDDDPYDFDDATTTTHTSSTAHEYHQDSTSWNPPPKPKRTIATDFEDETKTNNDPNYYFRSPTTTVPSLFTLRHPLDEIRPVAVLSSTTGNATTMFSNVFEKIIFVEQNIAVTFHTRYNRHTVWLVSKSTPPLPEATIHELAQQQNPQQNQQLHPFVSLRPIWMEPTTTKAQQKQQQQAENVFLASGHCEKETLLCFLVNNHSSTTTTTNNNLLRIFSLANDNNNNTIIIQGTKDIHCISAQPIKSTNGQAIDILVLLAEEEGNDTTPASTNRLYLYRSDFRIVECTFPSSTLLSSFFDDGTATHLLQNTSIIGLKHSVSSRVNVLFRITTNANSLNHYFTVRASISMTSMLSSITETCLKAIECSLVVSPSTSSSEIRHTQNNSEFVLLLRSDCIRAMQFFGQGTMLEEISDPSWTAFSIILQGLLSSSVQFGSNYDKDDDYYYLSGEDKKAEDDDDAWVFLNQSDFNNDFIRTNSQLFQYRRKIGLEETNNTNNTTSHRHLFHRVHTGINLSTLHLFDKVQHLPLIFDGLHLLYEDAKLVSASRGQSWLFRLGSILSSVVGDLVLKFGQQNASNNNTNISRLAAFFLDHYRRDLGDEAIISVLLQQATTAKNNAQTKNTMDDCLITSNLFFTTFQKPPCIFSWLEFLIQQGFPSYSFPLLDQVCVATQRIHRFYSILFESPTSSKQPVNDSIQSKKDEELVLAIIDEGIHNPTDELYSEIPPSVAIPIMEALHRCRDDPPNVNFSVAAFQLIGRQDLAAMEMIKQGVIKRPKPSTPASRLRSSCCSVAAATETATTSLHRNINAEDAPGESIEHFSSMLFPYDERIKEVAKLLRSSRPHFLRVKRPIEVSDHDFEHLKQVKLLLLCRRGLAAPLGRGMLTFATVQPVMAEPLHIPDLVLEGRVPPSNATLTLDTTDCQKDMTVWPEFHNGVAAGLRVDFNSSDEISGTGAIRQEGREQAVRTWIVYNKPTLSGLDNTTNRSTNSSSIAANALVAANHAHGGFLMALGLRGYLAALAMTDIYDYLTQGIVTTTVGVLLGMAANKRGTCDAAVSKMLCLHIPSLLPPSFSAMEVASAAQAAAVSGIGLLYQGSSHRMMTEFLLNEIGRRPTSDSSTHDREGFTLACGLALGMVNIAKGGEDMSGLADLRIVDRLVKYIVGGRDGDDFQRRREASDRATSTGGHNDHEKTSRIYEGDSINTDVTAPGATLALGLIFMRSGDKSVASHLSLPDTSFLLDYVRPDLLLLRVVARSLILWNEVEPTAEWIEDQVPLVVTKAYDMLSKTATRALGLSSILAVGRVEPMVDEDSSEDDLSMTARFSVDSHIDRQAVRQVYSFIVAGGCFSIGLRYAGTGSKAAASTITKYVRDFHRLRNDNDPLSVVERPGKQILEMCCACAAMSLAMVMAGTGDLEIFQLLRELRWRCDEEIRYGTHMSYGAAIGLLFLGGGSCTLGNEPGDIASMIVAFFPRFPSVTSDNQYHLQALRHVYALAVKQRSIETIDIESNQPVFVPVELSYTDDENNRSSLYLTTPCCLATNQGKKMELRLASNRYFPLSVELFQSGRVLTPSVVYVKKKSGYLSYVQDPRALKSLIVQAGGSSGSIADLIRSFTEDPRLISFAELLCDSSEQSFSSKGTILQRKDSLISSKEFCADILFECLTHGKTEVLSILLSLRNRIIERETISVSNLWDLRLLRSVVMHASSSSIVRKEFVALLCEHVDWYFVNAGFNGDDAVHYFNDPWIRKLLLGDFLVWFEIPSPFGLS